MKRIPLALVGFFVLCFSYAHAERLIIGFDGVVTSNDQGLTTITDVTIGEKVTGFYTFESAQQDQRNDPSFGLYSANQLVVIFKDLIYSSFDNNIAIINNVKLQPDLPTVDGYEIVSPKGDIFGNDISGLSAEQIDIVLADTSTSVFSSDQLPSDINLSQFDITSEFPTGTTGGRVIFQSFTTGQNGIINFEITNITQSKPTEPSVIIQENLDLHVQYARFSEFGLDFVLQYVENPSFDTENLVWKLDPQSLKEKELLLNETVIINQDLDLIVPSAKLSDFEFQFVLNPVPSIPESKDLYWELDINSFTSISQDK